MGFKVNGLVYGGGGGVGFQASGWAFKVEASRAPGWEYVGFRGTFLYIGKSNDKTYGEWTLNPKP